MSRCLLFFVVLSGCASVATGRPSVGPAPVTSRCSLLSGELFCRWVPGSAVERVAGGVVAHAPRLGGGVFVLGRDGTLERRDRRGRLTGRISTRYASLVAAGRYACGTADGGVACFRDGHEDLTCPTGPFEPLIQEVARTAAPLSGDPRQPILRVGSRAHRIGGTCGQHCVQLGCDGPRRCIDPCRGVQSPALVAEPLHGTPEDFFSK